MAKFMRYKRNKTGCYWKMISFRWWCSFFGERVCKCASLYVCVYLSKAMLRVLRCVETIGEVSLCAVFSCDGNMAARRDGASRGDRDSGSVYTTCFSWSTSITIAPPSGSHTHHMYFHFHVSLVLLLPDLSKNKHTQAYKEISLTLKRHWVIFSCPVYTVVKSPVESNWERVHNFTSGKTQSKGSGTCGT